MMDYFVKCKQLSREVWEEREYKMEKPENMAKCDFEKIARVFVGWDEDVEMEIKFDYFLNDTMCYVLVRERIE
jgi:hypothetical protein